MSPEDAVGAGNGNRRRWLLPAGLLLALLLFVLLRRPLFAEGALRLGWEGDTSIFGLMSNRMVEGRGFDVFFWGQNYLGTATSILAAAIGLVRRAAGIVPTVGPFSVRLAVLLEVGAGIVFWTLGLRRAVGSGAAVAAAVFLALGPGWMFRGSVLPTGPETVVLLGGLLFWIASGFGTPEGDTAGRRAAFGFVAGVAWWTNPGVVFVLAAAAFRWLATTPAWRALRANLRLADRIVVRPEALGWRRLNGTELVAIRTTGALLLFHLLHQVVHLTGLERVVGTPVPLFFVFWPLGEPIGLLLVYLLGTEVAFGRGSWPARFDGLRPRRPSSLPWKGGGVLAASFLVGFAPVWVGKLLGWYSEGYSFAAAILPAGQWEGRFRVFFSRDIWAWLGTDPSPWGTAFAAGSVALALGGLVAFRNEARPILRFEAGEHRPMALAAWTVIFAFVFYLFSATAGAGQQRYIVAALPAAWGLLAAAALRFARAGEGIFRLAGRTLAALWLVVAVTSVASTSLRERADLLSARDSSPLLARIEAAGCAVTFSDYDQVYRLRFLSDDRRKLVVWRGLDRSRDESRAWEALPGRKCFLDPLGNVTDAGPEKERERRRKSAGSGA